ncbi:MAG: penicillin-binding protein activator LpoB [Pseudomonadota bacterium]
MRKFGACAAVAVAGFMLTGCATGVENAAGSTTAYVAPGAPAAVQGVGVQSDDVAEISDSMLRDLLATPSIVSRTTPARVILDESEIKNFSSQIIDKGLFTDRLRSGLNRNAAGRIFFVNRASIARVQQERDLKRQGTVDVGTTGLAKAMAGADYQMTGAIRSQDAINSKTGMTQRNTQIVFELTDLENGIVIWTSEAFNVGKAAQNDVVYR